MTAILRLTGTLVCVFATTPLFAAAPTFKDRAGLFRPEAVQQTKGVVDEIRGQFHKDIAIETFKALPFYKDPLGKVKKMSPAEQDRFVLDWAKDRLSGRDTIYILIVHGPTLKNVQVVAGRSLVAHHGFTAENCRAVRERLQSELAADQADAGLPAALRLVQVLLHDNLGDGGGAEPFDWQAVLAVALFAAAVAVTVFYMRRSPAPAGSDLGQPSRPRLVRTPLEPGTVKPVHEPLKDWW